MNPDRCKDAEAPTFPILRHGLHRGPGDHELGMAFIRTSRCYDGDIMMQRTQISLEASEHRRARRRASELGISLAEYIRRLVRRDIGEAPAAADVSALFALGDSGGSDVASAKDVYLGEAVRDHRRS